MATLLAKAETADAADVPDGMSIPEELARREERLRKIAEARAKIEARARERHERELAEHEAKLAARAAKTAATGKKPGGKPPEPPAAGAAAERPDQSHRRGLAHHAGGRRRLRPMLQCAGRGGRGQHPNKPELHEPFVHLFDRLGGNHKRRSPANILSMPDLYTIFSEGKRDLSIEQHFSQRERVRQGQKAD